MSASVELVLMKCGQCSTPLPAEEDEVAWMCPTCGHGWQLAEAGLEPLRVHWAAARPGHAVNRWLPFWVFTGKVHFSRRESFGRQQAPEPLWQTTCRLFVPAFPCKLDQLEQLGASFTRQQVLLRPAPPAGPLQACTLLPDDARRAAEFVVLTIEADRRDRLKSVDFRLQMAEPELWVLPFAGEPDLRTLLVAA